MLHDGRCKHGCDTCAQHVRTAQSTGSEPQAAGRASTPLWAAPPVEGRLHHALKVLQGRTVNGNGNNSYSALLDAERGSS